MCSLYRYAKNKIGERTARSSESACRISQAKESCKKARGNERSGRNYKSIRERIRPRKRSILQSKRRKKDSQESTGLVIIKETNPLYSFFQKLLTTIIIIDALDSKPELYILIKYVWQADILKFKSLVRYR